jgi:transcription antitermination factor NusG
MKKPNHETIYLIPGSYDGEHCYVWSDDPAPGTEDNPADAVAYVRSDLAYSLANHLERQIAFSIKAFGPNKRTGGIIDHMKKELVEVANAPDDLTEWIDLAMLALDGAWRHVDRTGMSFTQVAELVQKTLTEKLAKNEARIWPDWRELSEDKAIEHDRTNEPDEDDPAAIAVMAGHFEDLAQDYEQVKSERDALVAQVEQFRKELEQSAEDAVLFGSLVAATRINALLASTPDQCLAEIKAQAVEDFGRWIKETDHLSAFPVHPSGLAIEYANKLRQQAKAGE